MNGPLLGNLNFQELVSVANSVKKAGLDSHIIEHAAGAMYVLTNGDDMPTHWFKFVDIASTIVFEKIAHLYKDYYVIYINGVPHSWYNRVTKNSDEIKNYTSIALIREGIMADVLRTFETHNLHITHAFSYRATYFYKADGNLYIWMRLKYNYVFAHVFPLHAARENVLFRVSKQSQIGPYLQQIAGKNVKNTENNFGCCELTERYLNSTGIVFPFPAHEQFTISLIEMTYHFYYENKEFKLRIDGNKLVPTTTVEQFDGHMPSSYYVELAIKRIDEHIKKEAKSGTNPVFVPYNMIMDSQPIITWLDNLCKKYDYQPLFSGNGPFRIYLYGNPASDASHPRCP